MCSIIFRAFLSLVLLTVSASLALAAPKSEEKVTPPPPPLPTEGKFNANNAKPLLKLGVDKLVFAMRQVDGDGHWYANFGHNSQGTKRVYYHDGGTLSLLDLKSGKVKHLINDPLGGVRDPKMHYSGKKILFSYRKGGQPYYNLYEINVDGKNLRQITKEPYDDIEPTYLPDGGIAFCSSRCNRFVQCYFVRVAIVYRCDADGSNIHQLSCNVEQDNTPWVLPDGRILYQRWEYIDRSQVRYHHLWTMNPDGTNQMVYFGNMHASTVMIDAKPIPNTQKIVASFSPGHGQKEHAGWVTVVDPGNGPDDTKMAKKIGKEKYRDPFPFSEELFLVARENDLGLLDGEGNYAPIWELSDTLKSKKLWVHEPRPVKGYAKERVIPKRTDLSKDHGVMMLENVYIGRNMAGIEKGDIKKLLVLEALPKPANFSGGMEPLTMGGSFTLERVLGTAPVEEDGSAHFELPPQRSLFFVALDKDNLSVKRMQSFTMVRPGEHLSCIGCHEERGSTPPVGKLTTAMRRPPSKIQPVPGNLPDVFDFPRDIQPILDKHCLKCHDYVAHGKNKEGKPNGPRSGGVLLSGDHSELYSISYVNLTKHRQFADGRNGAGNRAPRTIGTSASPLMKKLSGEHNGVRVSPREKDMIRYWIESAAPYPGTYASLGCGMYRVRSKYPDKCDQCHREQKVTIKSRADWYNLDHPEKSLALLAPLSKKAGGMGICEAKGKKPVFTSKEDKDYKAILESITQPRTFFEHGKRFDLPGFIPNRNYLREMKNYGILPADHDDTQQVDYYELDQKYWKSLWHK